MATEKYLGGTNDLAKKKYLFLDMLADLIFGVPAVTTARYHRGESQRSGERRQQLHPASAHCPYLGHRHK